MLRVTFGPDKNSSWGRHPRSEARSETNSATQGGRGRAHAKHSNSSRIRAHAKQNMRNTRTAAGPSKMQPDKMLPVTFGTHKNSACGRRSRCEAGSETFGPDKNSSWGRHPRSEAGSETNSATQGGRGGAHAKHSNSSRIRAHGRHSRCEAGSETDSQKRTAAGFVPKRCQTPATESAESYLRNALNIACEALKLTYGSYSPARYDLRLHSARPFLCWLRSESVSNSGLAMPVAKTPSATSLCLGWLSALDGSTAGPSNS